MKLPVVGNDPIPTLAPRICAAIASRTPARYVDGHDRWKARAWNLAGTVADLGMAGRRPAVGLGSTRVVRRRASAPPGADFRVTAGSARGRFVGRAASFGRHARVLQLPLETAFRLRNGAFADCAPQESGCDRRGPCGPLGVRAVRTIRSPAALFEMPPMRASHRRSAVAGGAVQGAVRRVVGRLQATVVNWRYDLGAPSVRTHNSAIGDTVRRVPESLPAGKNGVVSDRRKGVAHRVPNSWTKNMTTVRVYSHTCLCKIPVAIDVLRHDHYPLPAHVYLAARVMARTAGPS